MSSDMVGQPCFNPALLAYLFNMALQVPLPGTGKILGYVWQRGLKMYLALLLTLNKRSLPYQP